jgi:uncharacterized repeat protein (TIGR04076 family)
MAKNFDVEISVKSITQNKGCSVGHKIGDTWLVNKSKTPEGICLGSFNAFLPALRVLRAGGGFSFDKDKDITYVSCPDPHVQVVWQLKRLHPD